MKRSILFISLIAISFGGYSQKIRFSNELNKFCERSILEFDKIPSERKVILDKIAGEIVLKNNIVFTCQTNTRRTQLLQTWMQTAFYYYGIYNKTALSYGDTATEIAPAVISVLKKSGFIFSESNTKPKVWVFYVGEKYHTHGIYPKVIKSQLDEKGNVVVSICMDNEPVSHIGINPFHLAYQSPLMFEKTKEEKVKYDELNKQISVEMLYLADKVKDIIMSSSYR